MGKPGGGSRERVCGHFAVFYCLCGLILSMLFRNLSKPAFDKMPECYRMGIVLPMLAFLFSYVFLRQGFSVTALAVLELAL